MIKLTELLKEAPQIKKVKNVSVQYFGAEYAGEMAFSGYFRKAWLYKKDNGEWFAVIITKNKNKYEIQLINIKMRCPRSAIIASHFIKKLCEACI